MLLANRSRSRGSEDVFADSLRRQVSLYRPFRLTPCSKNVYVDDAVYGDLVTQSRKQRRLRERFSLRRSCCSILEAKSSTWITKSTWTPLLRRRSKNVYINKSVYMDKCAPSTEQVCLRGRFRTCRPRPHFDFSDAKLKGLQIVAVIRRLVVSPQDTHHSTIYVRVI